MAVAAQSKKETPVSVPGETLDYLEATFLLLFAAFLLTSWVSFTLAEFGLDRPVVVLALGFVGLLAGSVIVFRRRWRKASPGALAGLCLPILIGAVLYFPPDEWILGALDPGSYVNAGVTIARTGSIVFRDPVLTKLEPRVHDAFFLGDGNRLPGFYMVFAHFRGIIPDGIVVTTDRVVPHGFHLFPTILAFGYAVGGIRAELLVTPILALLALAGFYLGVRRLFGTTAAAAAVLILAIDPAQVWFARYPAAEILTQLLLFGGFLAFAAMVDVPNRWFALVAGLALGEVHLAKIEMLPLPFLIAAYLGYQALVGRFDRRWLWFVGTYVLLVIQAILHAVLIAYWYAMLTVKSAISGDFAHVVLAATVTGITLVVILTLVPSLRQRFSSLITHPRWEAPLRIGIPILVAALAIYGYFIRPGEAPALPAAQMNATELYVTNNLQSLVRLGWFVTPLGLFLGTLGWMLIAARGRDRRTILVLLVISVDTLLFLYDMKITPIYYWAARRWVPLVIPGFSLATGYLLAQLIPRTRERMIVAVPTAGCSLLLIFGLLRSLQPLLGYVEYRGAISQLGALAAVIPPDGMVLFPDGNAGQRFSTPLEYIFRRSSFLLKQNTPMNVDQAANAAARRWISEGHPVYWVSTAAAGGPAQLGLRGTVVARETISLPEKVATKSHAPGEAGAFKQELEVWRLSD